MAKAVDACSEARLLLGSGYPNGAANRAYYAMFDAARAALLASGAPVDLNEIRTHPGLLGTFGKYLVKDGPVSKDLNQMLNNAREVRMTADYDGESVELGDAKTIVEQAEAFVAAMREQFMPEIGEDEGPRQ